MAITLTYMGAKGDHLPLGGSNDVADQHQPARSEVPRARQRGAQRAAAEPVLRQPERSGVALDAGDAHARAAADAVPAVRASPRPAGHRGQEPVQRGRRRVDQASQPRLGRPLQLHLQRAEGQPDRRGQLLLAPNGGNLPLNNYNYIRRRRRARRASSSPPPATIRDAEYGHGILDVPHRVIIAPIFELPFGKGKKYASNSGAADCDHRRLDDRVDHDLQTGFPLNVQQSNPNSAVWPASARGRTSSRASISRRPATTTRSPRVGGSPDGDLDQPGGVLADAVRHLRQHAAHDHRSADADAVQHRRQLQEELPPRRLEAGAAEARSAEPVQPVRRSARCTAQHVRAGQQLRPDDVAVRLHADHCSSCSGSRF